MADQTFTYVFQYGSIQINLTASVTTPATDSTGVGTGYAVTTIGGSIGSTSITGEAGSGGAVQSDNQGYSYDNTIFTSGGKYGNTSGIDNYGLEFTAGGYQYNILANNGSFYLTKDDGSFANQITLVSTDAPCYATGTRIRTTAGDVAVEHLRIGDLVVTASGAHRPIRWLGHRTVDPRRHPRPSKAQPVRIAAHAFGENRPARDLFVSTGHAICVDVLGEVLIPAGALVNGATITQVEVDEVTYWHVELETHDVILAENLPAESYLDMANRDFFSGGDVVALTASPDAAQRTHADFCRHFVDGGPILAAVRVRIAARADAVADVVTVRQDVA